MRLSFFNLIAIILFFNCSYAQKCKPKYIDKDKFTEINTEYWGGSLTSMSVYSYDVKYSPSMFLIKQDNENKIVFGITVDGKLNNNMLLNNQTWFEKGSKIILKLENEMMEFIYDNSSVNQAGYTSVKIIVPISLEQIEKLQNQKIEKVKINPFVNSEEMRFQFSVAKGRDKKFKEQLSCFLQS